MNFSFPSTRRRGQALLRGLLMAVAAALAAEAVAQPPAATPAAVSDDPIVQALLDTRPGTPPRMLEVIDILISLKAAPAARPLMEQLMAAGLDAEQMAELGRTFGAGLLLKLSLSEPLQPEGKQFADAVLAAMEQQASDPARVASLVQQAADNAPPAAGAVDQLVRGGKATAVLLTNMLLDDAQASLHPTVQRVLAAIGGDAIDPLAASLASENQAARDRCLIALAHVDDNDAWRWLLAPAWLSESETVRQVARGAVLRELGELPSRSAAAARLYVAAETLYKTTPAPEAPPAEPVVIWDPAGLKVQQLMAPPRLNLLARAMLMLEGAHQLSPTNAQVQQLRISAWLELESLAAAGQPLPREEGSAWHSAAQMGPDFIARLLRTSMDEGRIEVAIAAVHLLTDARDTSVLYADAPRPSVLVDAARHADPRLRFHAAGAIVTRLSPQSPYPGSSFVADAVGQLIRSSGRQKVLVIDPRPIEAQRLVGLLVASGLEAEAASDLQQAIVMATSSADYELFLVDWLVAGTRWGQMLEQLRRDSRTKLVPIAVVASHANIDEAEELARTYDGVGAFIRPYDSAAMLSQITSLLAVSGRVPAPAPERLQQAQSALEWMANWCPPGSLYELRRMEAPLVNAVWQPALSAASAEVLACLGTPRAQRTLVNVASTVTLPLELREAASQAFSRSVDHFGILLTTSEIELQYDRYNQSAALDEATQKLLGSILDRLEAGAGPPPAEPVEAPQGENV